MTDCGCGGVIKARYADDGIETFVTEWRPDLFPTGYDDVGLICPHGVRWHAEPTAEQKLKWAAEGVS